MEETTELLRLCGQVGVAMMHTAPGFEARMAGGCAMSLSGEPSADLNMIHLSPGPGAEDFLIDAVARVRVLGLPVLAMMAPAAVDTLAPVAERLGLSPAGTAPLMVLRAETSVAPSRPCDIRRALGAEAVGASSDLAAAAFGLDREQFGRVFDGAVTETGGVEVYLAFGEAGPMSTVSVSRHGSTAGIWTMATPPQHQGKGIGRALLSGVMDRFRREGVGRFYLIATAAGRPLYESLGYEAVADLSAWVLGHSTQVGG